MKKILFLAALICASFSIQAQSITTSGGSGYVYIGTGENQAYKLPDIYCFPEYDPFTGNIKVKLIMTVAGAGRGSEQGSRVLTFTTAQINAFTGAGANQVAKFLNAVNQAVADYLGTITENSGVTFTAA
jgi:hypothetical protein